MTRTEHYQAAEADLKKSLELARALDEWTREGVNGGDMNTVTWRLERIGQYIASAQVHALLASTPGWIAEPDDKDAV